MKVARGSKNLKTNRAILGVMINGVFIHKGMEIEVTGYDQDHMNNKEQITVRGTVIGFDDCMLYVRVCENDSIYTKYIHLDGVKKIVYDFEENE